VAMRSGRADASANSTAVQDTDRTLWGNNFNFSGKLRRDHAGWSLNALQVPCRHRGRRRWRDLA